VVIYETTSDTSTLKTDRLHILLDFPAADKVQVIEMHIITNPTNRTMVSDVDGGAVVKFTLPEGATNLDSGGALMSAF
jgi:hypothetical protein